MRANHGHVYSSSVREGEAGRRLLEWLVQRFPHSDAPTWTERLREGRVEVAGKIAGPDQILRVGEQVCWHRPPWVEARVPLQFAVLYRDAHLLGVAKPSGLPTLPGGDFHEHCLLRRVQAFDPAATPLHRLGRGTSGVVLFARSSRARSRLSAAWRERRVQKTYRARVCGHPLESCFEIRAPIGPRPHPLLGNVHSVDPRGKPAFSQVRVLQRDPGSLSRPRSSLVEVDIETGRPHQIRIHLAHAGHPLLGDPLYTDGARLCPTARPSDLGYSLHALRLVVPDPENDRPRHLECAAPHDLRPQTLRTQRESPGS